MKKATVIALAALFFISIKFSFSQSEQHSVGINTNSPASSAALHVSSANQGVLLPLVGLTDLRYDTQVPNPVNGLIVFNTTFNPQLGLVRGLYIYDAGLWKELVSSDRTYGFAAYGEIFEANPFNGGTNYSLPLGVHVPWISAEEGLCVGVAPDINGTDYLEVIEGGAYQVALSISFQGDNSMQVSTQVYINRVGFNPIPVEKIQVHCKLGSNGDLVSGAASGIVDLEAGDKVYVMFTCDNATKNMQVEVMNLSIAKIYVEQ